MIPKWCRSQSVAAYTRIYLWIVYIYKSIETLAYAAE